MSTMKPFRLSGVLFVICLSLPPISAAARSVVELSQDDFRYGSYIIDRPGRYRLTENISFNPNSPSTLSAALASGELPAAVAARLGLPPAGPVDAFLARVPAGRRSSFAAGVDEFQPGGLLAPRYDPKGFGLGFFAAIVIAADGVELDLGGYRIEQSAEHALLQRFFAVIELAEQPFIPAQGPADFGDTIRSANNVVIRNGVIGRSAHHGIHGNGNRNVVITDVDFEDYEGGSGLRSTVCADSG